MRGVFFARIPGLALCALGLLFASNAKAEITFLMEEPFGTFGALNPTGHAAVYLSRVCADSPTHLRRCSPGERGVVISRYHEIAGYDWLAVPVIPYFYAVERVSQIPRYASAADVARMRENYRRHALRDLVPDQPDVETPAGEWIQLVGSSYDRKIYAYRFETTAEQDDRLIEQLNAGPNVARFNLFWRNCADFARAIVNNYAPGLLHRGRFADPGMTTPKQIAKTLVKYGRRHNGPQVTCFIIPQISGEAPRSRKIRGVFESLVMSKKYAAPLILLKPVVVAGLAVGYVTTGRFDPRRHVNVPQSVEWEPADVLAQFAPAVAHDVERAFRDGALGQAVANAQLAAP